MPPGSARLIAHRRRFGSLASAALLAGAWLLAAAPASAVTCNLNVVTVVFGAYDPLANQSVDSAGSVTVSCSGFASYSVALSPGYGTMLARRMQSGSNGMYYNLYTDLQRSSIWGDGTGGTALVNGSGTNGSYTIYGRIPGGQNIPAGTYSDAIAVTLTF
jgi:spore coat protein U-like protein